MQNLGRAIFLLFMSAFYLHAAMQACLEPEVTYRGESVTYKLTMSGEEIQKPKIENICGNEIISKSSQTSIESINGNTKKSYILSYEFLPQSSCLIPEISTIIDGKKESSNAIKLELKEPSKEQNAPFELTLTPSKTSLYVGEPFLLTLSLKQEFKAQVLDSQFTPPVFEGFWLKSQTNPKRVKDATSSTTTIVYTLAPQREGNITIKPAQLKVASQAGRRNSWGVVVPDMKWRSYYSNEEHFAVQPLPNGAKLIGDFAISLSLDKRKIEANEALNVTISVTGEGNLEDIQSFKPSIQGVSVFEEERVIANDLLTQKLAFVADENFTIPPFELIYFDTKTEKVRKIQTQSIAVEVIKDPTASQGVKIEKEHQTQLSSSEPAKTPNNTDLQSLWWWFVGMFLFGVAVGAAGVAYLKSGLLKRKESIPKDEKLLFMKLLAFKEDAEVAAMLDLLEQNIYSEHKTKIDKKELQKLLKRHKLL